MRFKDIKQLANDQERMQEIYEYLRIVKNESELFSYDNTPISARMVSWDLRTTEDHINELCRKMLQDTVHYPSVTMIHRADRNFYRYTGD
ncbi:MAG: hypothetical protein ABIF11_05865 [Nitrospirota bacterium]